MSKQRELCRAWQGPSGAAAHRSSGTGARRSTAFRSSTRAPARVAAAAGGNGAEVENVVIIGSGPAGYTAAIYAARANLRPLVFEGVQRGGVRGGQLMTTTEVENFPGFPEGITGPDLMDRMRQQAERWGARLVTEDVASLDLSRRPFAVVSDEGTEAAAHAVIMATGATAKRLGIPSEQEYWSSGISACAICDGASPLFKGQELAVVGGGDTATEEALYLTKYASRVHLLVRGEKMRASGAMQTRTLAHPKVTVHYNTAVEDAYGEGGKLTGLHLVDTKSGAKRDMPVKGLFYGIGHKPNSELVAGQVRLDDTGYVVVEHGCRTSVDGCFSAGDLHDAEWRQASAAITAAGSGCMAALAAERYLAENGLVQEAPAEAAAPAASTSTAEAEATRKSDKAAQDTEDTFDIQARLGCIHDGMTGARLDPGGAEFADKHKGQFALRKLYHESDRPLMVLYTAPTCGPCRTLKPILSKVVDEYAGRVHYVEIDIDVFKAKARVAQMAGVKMKADYRKVLDAQLGN
eukprot:scaffold9.g3302.t1